MQQTVQDQLVHAPPATRRPGLSRRLAHLAITEYSILILSLCYFLIAWPIVPGFVSPENLGNLLQDMMPLLIVAIGQTIVLITGGIDLSMTSVIALSSVAGAWIMSDSTGVLAHSPWAVPAAIGVMLLVGLGVGLFNGLAVTVLKMPPFIVTLAVMTTVSGLAIWSTKSQSIGNLPAGFLTIGSESLWGIPYALLVAAAVAIVAHVVLNSTVFGQWLYAVGHSTRVAAVSGVPNTLVITAAYALSGLCAAVGSVIYTARLETGMPTLGREILLDVVGAAVIGGTSLFGGRGKILWTVFGVMLFALIANTLNGLGLQYYTIWVVKGAIILLVAALDLLRAKVAAGGAA